MGTAQRRGSAVDERQRGERVTAAEIDSGGEHVPDDIDIHTTAGKLADFERRVQEATHAGSERAIEKQHAAGKMTARERIEELLDPGSFTEFDEFARHRSTTFGMESKRPFGDGVVTGYGTVDGRPVAIFSQDVTVFGGSLGEVYGEKIVKILDFAMKNGCPVVGINEGGGARIQEGVVSLGLYGEIFQRNVHASGVIPQISLVMGPAAGGHVYSPALTDFIVMVDKTSQMFITGPDVVKTVTGEEVTLEELGGARTHNTKSGVAHYLAEDEADALDYVKALLSYLPSNNLDPLPAIEVAPAETVLPDALTDVDLELDTFIPDSANTPYDMHTVLEHVLDDGEFLEVQPLFAPNILIGFGRVEGRPVGVVANQPTQFAGTLDIDASEKAARFVRTCDCFNIPVLTFVDVPGLPAGHLAGVGGDHPPRREADLRLRRGHRPEGHGDHAQGLRRRLRRHGLQAPGRGHQPGLAERADRRRRGAGRRRHPVPQGTGRGEGPRRPPGGADRRVRGHPRQPLHRRRPGLRRRRHPAVPHARPGDQGAPGPGQQAADPAPEEAREHPVVSEGPPAPLLRVV